MRFSTQGAGTAFLCCALSLAGCSSDSEDAARFAMAAEDTAAIQPGIVEGYREMLDPRNETPITGAGTITTLVHNTVIRPGDFRAVPYLSKVAESHPRIAVRAAAVAALSVFLPASLTGDTPLSADEREQVRPQMEMAVSTTLKALRSPDENVRRHAAGNLSKIHTQAALDAAIEALKDPNAEVRMEAFQAIIVATRHVHQSGKARAAVEQLVHGPDKFLAKHAAELLENWDRSP